MVAASWDDCPEQRSVGGLEVRDVGLDSLKACGWTYPV